MMTSRLDKAINLITELEQQNATLVEALEKIAEPEGAYSRDDPYAENTIKSMVDIAEKALAAVLPP